MATYFMKRKHMELKFKKKKEIVKGKKLSQPGMFPINMQDDENQWKFSLDYDVQGDTFILHIDDEPFLGLPYQSELTPTGPENILAGGIKLNEVQVHAGFRQYKAHDFEDWRVEHKLQPTTDFFIGAS